VVTKKTRMTPFLELKKCDVMSIRLDTIPALDRQTDGRTEMVKQYRALHALHSDVR